MTHSHPSGPSTASSRTASDDGDAPYTVAELHDRWVLERLLGSGSQGQVWRARERKAPSNVIAIKCLRDCQDARYEIEAYEQLETTRSTLTSSTLARPLRRVRSPLSRNTHFAAASHQQTGAARGSHPCAASGRMGVTY